MNRPASPIDMDVLCHVVGWDTILAVTDGEFDVERTPDGATVGMRLTWSGWSVIVLHTPDGFSVGVMRSMIPFGWVHAIAAGDVPNAVIEAAVSPSTWAKESTT